MTELFTPGAHGLIGPNGAGKTTYLNNYFHQHLGTGTVAMSQTGSLNIFAGIALGHHLKLAATAYPHFDRARALEIAGRMGLTERSHFRSMSAGQQQLCAVATAIAANAPVLLLDEPFNALDVTQRQHIREDLIDLLAEREDHTVVITSHRSEDLTGLVTDVTLIQEFTLSQTYSLETIVRNYPTLTGPIEQVNPFARGEVARKVLGTTAAVTLSSPLDDAALHRITTQAPDVQVTYPSEQELIDLLIGVSNAH